MRRLLFCLLFALTPAAAQAGAWTREAGSWQQISSALGSAADRSFGTPTPIHFRKALLQTYTEYGLSNAVTLFAASESAYVEVTQGGLAPYNAFDNAIEGGARFHLRRGDWGVLSLETSLRTAGAFNFAVSANPAADGDGGRLRLLYGRSFRMGARYGFLDVGAGRQFLSGDRADETELDVTLGLWLNPNNMVMVQSFNRFAGAGAIAAYSAFESHKLQFSWVRRMSRHFYLQAGGFFSPAGRNTLDEQGLALALWTRF
jgi:hypothetical protein